MSRGRDNQRSRVYAWEAAITKDALYQGTMKTLDEVEAFLKPIWRSERGRVGRANVAMPSIDRPHRGQRRALAYASHRITLPRWARNPWVILHEAAHRLTPRDEAHGPRFVGVLIGLVCRHLGFDANDLMARADEMGVKYHVRSIGVVPVHGTSWHVEKAVREEGPMTEMDIACWLDLSYLQVRGAALSLIRQGRARWLRRKLVLIGAATVAPMGAPLAKQIEETRRQRKAPGPTSIKGKAKLHGIEIENCGGGLWFVYPPSGFDDRDDPYEDDHSCNGWYEVGEHVDEYVRLLTHGAALERA